jgi:hypothetical protein
MAATGKPRANDDEVLLLIYLRRQAAKEAMRQIVQRFAEPPHYLPQIHVLTDYLLNMVLCVELMLKMLSHNWHSHDVGEMYRSKYGQPHPNPALMDAVHLAIRDQKYLHEPSPGISNFIPELEKLHDELVSHLAKEHGSFAVRKSVSLPPSFAAFIRDDPQRFMSIPCPSVQGSGPPPPDMQDQWRQRVDEYVRNVESHFGSIADSGKSLPVQTLHIYGLID